jgi:adenine phosphoribosyltransferase
VTGTLDGAAAGAEVSVSRAAARDTIAVEHMAPSGNRLFEDSAPDGARSQAHRRAAAEMERRLQTFAGFPAPGVLFRDLSPVYAAPELLRELTDVVVERYRDGFDYVAGVEARGFLLGMAVSWAAGVPLVLVRKAGKLPGAVHALSYESEYAAGTLEMQEDALPSDARVLLVDDVVATGETLKAAAQLIERSGAEISGLAVLLELRGLPGRSLLDPYPLFAVHEMEA